MFEFGLEEISLNIARRIGFGEEKKEEEMTKRFSKTDGGSKSVRRHHHLLWEYFDNTAWI